MTFFQRLFFSKQESRLTPVLSALFGGFGSGLLTSGSNMQFRKAVDSGYKGIVWVYRCVSALGQAVGSVPWKVYEKQADGQDKPLPGHPLEVLLARPNPYADRSEFFAAWITYLSLSGNAYWEKVFVKPLSGPVRGKPVPRHLYHIRPDWLKPKPHPNLYISEYEFDPGGAQKRDPFEPSAIVHFKYLDPTNEFVGMSPLTAAARTMDTENAAIGWNKAILDNYGVPGGVLKVPAQTLIDEDKKTLQEELDKEFSGENRYRPMVLWGGMEWDQMSLSQQDMQFLEQRRLNKYEICAIFGMPPPYVGANEDPTYSNYSISRLSLWEDTITPLLDWLKSKINTQVAPYFGDNIFASYDISDVPAFRESFAAKVKTAEVLTKMMLPVNAINARLKLGFDPVPWGDVAWMPMNLVPVAGVPEEPEDEPPEDEETVERDPVTGEPIEPDEEEPPEGEPEPAGAGTGGGIRKR